MTAAAGRQPGRASRATTAAAPARPQVEVFSGPGRPLAVLRFVSPTTGKLIERALSGFTLAGIARLNAARLDVPCLFAPTDLELVERLVALARYRPRHRSPGQLWSQARCCTEYFKQKSSRHQPPQPVPPTRRPAGVLAADPELALLLSMLRKAHGARDKRGEPWAAAARAMARDHSIPQFGNDERRIRRLLRKAVAIGELVITHRGGSGPGDCHLYRFRREGEPRMKPTLVASNKPREAVQRDADFMRVVEALRSGMSIRKVAQALGVPKSTVHWIKQQHAETPPNGGVSKPAKSPPGVQDPGVQGGVSNPEGVQDPGVQGATNVSKRLMKGSSVQREEVSARQVVRQVSHPEAPHPQASGVDGAGDDALSQEAQKNRAADGKPDYSPRRLLYLARVSGIGLVDDGELLFEVAGAVSAELLEQLQLHEREIIGLLRQPPLDEPGCLLMLSSEGGGYRQCGDPVGEDGIYCRAHGGDERCNQAKAGRLIRGQLPLFVRPAGLGRRPGVGVQQSLGRERV